MVDRAYNTELNKELDAKKANEYSNKGVLKSDKAFVCIDNNCQIPLTCTNWGKSDGKRYYFRPSHNDEPHIEGCIYISPREVKEQVNKEVEDAKCTISQSGIISVKKSISKAKTSGQKIDDSSVNFAHNRTTRRQRGERGKLQDRQLSALATFVELFYDDEIDNNIQHIRIDDELLTLDKLFVDVSKPKKVTDKNRIFFGKAKVSIANFNPEMLQIEFVESEYPKLYSNFRQIRERANTRNIADLVDKAPEYIYFRGLLSSKDNKFKSFNDKFYKDLHLPKNF